MLTGSLPGAGDIYGHPDKLIPAKADVQNLVRLYKLLHDAIRREDDRHIIFFEPTVLVQMESIVPLHDITETGLKEVRCDMYGQGGSHSVQGPGGSAYNNRQVFAYHVYCPYLTGDGQPKSHEVQCSTLVTRLQLSCPVITPLDALCRCVS